MLYLDIDKVQIATSLVCVGAWLGSMIGSYPSETFGRRKTLLWNNLFFIIGSLMCGSGSLNLLYWGQVIKGAGAGVASCACPLLLSEIAPEKQRGNITGLFPLFTRLGMLVVGVLSYGFVMYVKHGWQYVQVFCGFFGVVQVGK